MPTSSQIRFVQAIARTRESFWREIFGEPIQPHDLPRRPPANDSRCRSCGEQLGPFELDAGECGLCFVLLTHHKRMRSLAFGDDLPPAGGRVFPEIRAEIQYHGDNFHSAEW